MIKLKKSKTKAVICGVCLDHTSKKEKELSIDEMERLANTAGIQITDKIMQNRNKIDKTYYAGKGFVAEVVSKVKKGDIIIFDNELSPSHARNIEQDFSIDVVDRTEVILDIFKKHASTNEAKLQVRLAELNYQLPRLKKLWSHLDRERGGASGTGGTSRGMGEKQIEVDKRLVRSEIKKVSKQLEKVDKQMETQRKQRQNKKKVCLIGYTNAGKSTLFNKLTNAGVLVENKLFATLNSTAKTLEFEKGRDIVLSDTVGFISELPHHLVASFKATLHDVSDADLLLHVVDFADNNFPKYISEVNKVLKEIDADNIIQILVLNKIDKIKNYNKFPKLDDEISTIKISAKNGENVDKLLKMIEDNLFDSKEVKLLIPHTEQKAVNKLHNIAKILQTEYVEKGVKIKATINREDLFEFEEFVVS